SYSSRSVGKRPHFPSSPPVTMRAVRALLSGGCCSRSEDLSRLHHDRSDTNGNADAPGPSAVDDGYVRGAGWAEAVRAGVVTGAAPPLDDRSGSRIRGAQRALR